MLVSRWSKSSSGLMSNSQYIDLQGCKDEKLKPDSPPPRAVKKVSKAEREATKLKRSNPVPDARRARGMVNLPRNEWLGTDFDGIPLSGIFVC